MDKIEDVTDLVKLNAELEQRVIQRTTELEKANQELKRSNEELERFAYVASHDLQEPLRIVTNFLQLLARRYHNRLDETADKYIHFAVDGAARMKNLIQGLLDYSRAGKYNRNPQTVEVESLIRQALGNLWIMLEETKASVTWDPLPSVVCDPVELVQVFQNLIGNALKFRNSEPPRVKIRMRREGSHWLVIVEDNGIGIEPQHRQRIFEIFERLHPAAQYPGTGIGLAICKKIIESHGGSIGVESAIPNEGARFYFTLPIEGDLA